MILSAALGGVDISGYCVLGLRGLLRKLLKDHILSLASELAHIAEETWDIRMRGSDTQG